jgi:hypothetical protein
MDILKKNKADTIDHECKGYFIPARLLPRASDSELTLNSNLECGYISNRVIAWLRNPMRHYLPVE